jgi:release factor glutamine methyltransferase
MTIQEALHQGTRLLAEAEIPAPRLTAEVLLSHAVGCRREWLYAHSTDELVEVWWIHYGRYLHERLKGKPTQYITHVQEFYGRDFRVSPAVLIPRPETEHLIEAALARYDHGPIVDVGTGSGAIAVTLALETGCPTVFATDLSSGALAIARKNASALGAPIEFVHTDLLDAFRAGSMRMIVSNPPYIPLVERETLQREVLDHEPHLALFGGESGFAVYLRLIQQAEEVVQPGGWLLLELAHNGASTVSAMLHASGHWTAIERIADLAGFHRVIVAQRLH